MVGRRLNGFRFTITEISYSVVSLFYDVMQTAPRNDIYDIKFLSSACVLKPLNALYLIGLIFQSKKKFFLYGYDCMFGDYDFTQTCRSTGLFLN